MEHRGTDDPQARSWLPQELPPTPPPSAPTPAPPPDAATPADAPPPPPNHGTPPPPPSYGTPPGYAPPPGYATPPVSPRPTYATPPAARHSTLAVAGFVMSLVLAPVGLVLSAVALSRARRRGEARGFALAGVVIGTFGTLAVVTGIVLAVLQAREAAAEEAPREAFTAMMHAIMDHDCDAFADTVTDDFLATAGIATCDDFDELLAQRDLEMPLADLLITIEDVDVRGDVAHVFTNEPTPINPSQLAVYDYTLLLVEGRWLVDSVALAS